VGVKAVRVTLIGGGGGTGGYDGPTGSRRYGGAGGAAGKLVATLNLDSTSAFSFNIGCQGANGADRVSAGAGGLGGDGYSYGGAGGNAGGHGQSAGGGGGGGATGLTATGRKLAQGGVVFVAGGAGGGGGAGADREVVKIFTSTGSNPSFDSNGADGVSRSLAADGGGGGGGGGGYTTGGAGGPTNGANAPTPPSNYYPDYGATVGQAGDSGTDATFVQTDISTTANSGAGSVEFAWANVPVISNAPASITNSTSASFDIAGDTGATFECSVDDGAFAACTSPFLTSGLADGAHNLKVREVTLEGITSEAATYDWTVDTIAPLAPTLSNKPSSLTNSTSFSIDFTPAEAGGTVECSVDGGLWAPCTSPVTGSGLADGSHSVKVRQTDAAGNVGAEASYSWTVDATAPEAPVLSGQPTGTTLDNSASITITAEAGATLECSIDGGNWAPCTSPLNLSGLADGDHSVKARATDAAGNVSAESTLASWKVRRACVPPTIGTAWAKPTLVRNKWQIHPDGHPGANDTRPPCGLMTIQVSTSRMAPDPTVLPPDTPSYGQGILAYADNTFRRGPAPRWIRIENHVGQWSDWKQLKFYGR
jgi:hypothetical protein